MEKRENFEESKSLVEFGPLRGALQIGTNNYLPDEDVRVLQLRSLLQANVLQHVVQVVHDAVNQRHERNRTDADHVLLHVGHPVAAGRRQAHKRQEHRQAPEVLPPEWGRYLQLLDLQDEDVQAVQDVGGQLDEHHEEQQVVKENAVF